MKRHVLLYGLLGGVLITLLEWGKYRFLVVEHWVEIYGAMVALTFAGLGIWLGLTLTGKQKKEGAAAESPRPVTDRFLPDDEKRRKLGMTRREFEILGLIAEGLSNREIADKLFLSENTIKTHSGRVFEKLGARRRTQAVQLGREFGLLP